MELVAVCNLIKAVLLKIFACIVNIVKQCTVNRYMELFGYDITMTNDLIELIYIYTGHWTVLSIIYVNLIVSNVNLWNLCSINICNLSQHYVTFLSFVVNESQINEIQIFSSIPDIRRLFVAYSHSNCISLNAMRFPDIKLSEIILIIVLCDHPQYLTSIYYPINMIS